MSQTSPAHVVPRHRPGRLRLAAAALAVLVGCAIPAAAHQPFESSAIIRFDGDRVELEVTSSIEIAGQLIGQPTSDPAMLRNFQQRLTEMAGSLYEVKSDGAPVTVERTFFAVRAGEAVFSALYPIQRPAGLQFRAAYLDHLPTEYAGFIEAFDDGGNRMEGRTMLRRASNTFAIRTPALAGETEPATAPRAATIAASAVPSPRRQWLIFALAALIALPLSFLLIRQSRNSPKLS